MSTSTSNTTVVNSPSGMSLVKRVMFIGSGVFWVVVGAFGVFLPGIPTAGPLILASFFLARSCPPLERLLIRNRFFAAFHRYLDGEAEMPLRAKVISILAMWISISISCWMLILVRVSGSGAGSSVLGTFLLPGLIVLAGFVGTWFIIRFGRSDSTQR